VQIVLQDEQPPILSSGGFIIATRPAVQTGDTDVPGSFQAVKSLKEANDPLASQSPTPGVLPAPEGIAAARPEPPRSQRHARLRAARNDHPIWQITA